MSYFNNIKTGGILSSQNSSTTPLPLPELHWIGYWNMDKIERRYVDVGKVKDYDSLIVNITDDNGNIHNLNISGGHYWAGGLLWLDRHHNGFFDNTNFDDTTVVNRGYILIYK